MLRLALVSKLATESSILIGNGYMWLEINLGNKRNEIRF